MYIIAVWKGVRLKKKDISTQDSIFNMTFLIITD